MVHRILPEARIIPDLALPGVPRRLSYLSATHIAAAGTEADAGGHPTRRPGGMGPRAQPGPGDGSRGPRQARVHPAAQKSSRFRHPSPEPNTGEIRLTWDG